MKTLPRGLEKCMFVSNDVELDLQFTEIQRKRVGATGIIGNFIDICLQVG